MHSDGWNDAMSAWLSQIKLFHVEEGDDGFTLEEKFASIREEINQILTTVSSMTGLYD
jgi:hypothetical protein